jgi:transcriptional regulator with GAF, ATPase, and Fis domain/tetratricopeptide (TPR) repeat protein
LGATTAASVLTHDTSVLTHALSAPASFSGLDERLVAATHEHATVPTVLLARTTSAETARAIVAHAARKLRGLGLQAICARAHASAPLWQEVAAKLGISAETSHAPLSTDPSKCAERIASAMVARHAAVLAPLPAAGSWDRAVATELVRLAAPSLLLFVSSSDTSGSSRDEATDLRAEVFELGARLDASAKERWVAAVAHEAEGLLASDDLAALEHWWSATRDTVHLTTDQQLLATPADGEALFSALALARRGWSASEITILGGDRVALEALVRAGAVDVDRLDRGSSGHGGHGGGWVTITPAWQSRADEAAACATPAARAQVARALSRTCPDDAWARARAAELLLGAGTSQLDLADATHAEAVALLHDPLARREIIARWTREVDALPAASQLPLRVRAAERALAAGEADEAYRWSQSAAALAPSDPRVALLLGQAASGLGDLITAKVALERGRTLAASERNADIAALIAVELSEVAYLAGDIELARREAGPALEVPATFLRARNTLGKILLAQSKWDDADRHFAEDAWKASSEGNVSAELRARLNRGIALLSKGLVDEARTIFGAVLDEGERTVEPRACAFAYENLAVVAMWRHEYGTALSFFERALKVRQRLGDRLKIALNLGNLAELRYKLGLFDHADHAIFFGRRTLGPGMPHNNSARFSIVAARLALSRGNTAEARREVARAVADGETAGSRVKMAGEAHRVATRIALDDGDLGRAGESLAYAKELASSDEAKSEVGYLEALLARAAGEPVVNVLRLAEAALVLTRAHGEEELLRDAHVLLAEIHRGEGQIELARAHVEQAIALRDHVVSVLGGEVRDAFLARKDVAALTRMQAQLDQLAPNSDLEHAAPDSADRASDDGEPSRPSYIPRSRASDPGSFPREIVGDDPTVRGLRAAIKKVAKSDSTILIRGESGTGKELVAEALHRASDRVGGPLVTVNCAALVETLLLSELFGHEKGAFTGAAARRRGRFELAEGGTLFLDEIGDISARTQVALLRVLQERTFERVGGTTPIRANVRIVCATHRDLKSMVERGEFREDLYYRLRGITLEVPALRQRIGDLPRISENLLARIAFERGETVKTLAPAAIELLGRHRWSGNVRELENALRAASLFAETDVITARDLTDNVEDLGHLGQSRARLESSGSSDRLVAVRLHDDVPPAAPSTIVDLDASTPSSEDADDVAVQSFEDGDLPASEAGPTAIAYACVRQGSVSLSDLKRQIERDCIARALAETKGNITRAATLLGMKRPRLSQLVKQYGLAAVSEGSS